MWVLKPIFVTYGLMLQNPKTQNKVKISKSLFRDFPIRINRIDHDESENQAPEVLGYILKASIIKKCFLQKL